MERSEESTWELLPPSKDCLWGRVHSENHRHRLPLGSIRYRRTTIGTLRLYLQILCKETRSTLSLCRDKNQIRQDCQDQSLLFKRRTYQEAQDDVEYVAVRWGREHEACTICKGRRCWAKGKEESNDTTHHTVFCCCEIIDVKCKHQDDLQYPGKLWEISTCRAISKHTQKISYRDP